MGNKEYFVLTLQSGYDLREHDFLKAQDGSYLFTKEEALAEINKNSLRDFIPVAVSICHLEKIIHLLPKK